MVHEATIFYSQAFPQSTILFFAFWFFFLNRNESRCFVLFPLKLKLKQETSMSGQILGPSVCRRKTGEERRKKKPY